MFLANDSFGSTGGGATLLLDRALVPANALSLTERLRAAIARIDWTPDLGARIGSAEWCRGAATCATLIAAAWALSPGIARPVLGEAPPALSGTHWQNARAQGIAPLAWGADTGQRLAATTTLVRPLTTTPERPTIDVSAALGDSDSLTGLLRRSGVSRGDAAAAVRLIGDAVPVDGIRPGTRIDMVLGRRASRAEPRPLEKLGLRASLDLYLNLLRTGDGLTVQRQTIAVDDTPLRIQGLAGSSLYKSARAAGVPTRIAADYLKALASRVSLGGGVSPADRFDIIVEQRRAATGEVELGNILFAGLDQGRRKVQLVKWRGIDGDDDTQWFDASGQTERRGFMGLPVAGRLSSSFGMRMHPILGYYRMHKGIDIACAYGSPVYAVVDGIVNWAGGKAGYGNFVGIQGASGVGTGYGHLSRVLVRAGQRVERGQVVAYSGNSGLSTGPHLHFEVYRGGASVNPRGFSFSTVASLTGNALRVFRARVGALLSIRPGVAKP